MDLTPAQVIASRHGHGLEPDQLQSIERFLDSLYEANTSRNLTRVPPEEAVTRHVCDSLLVAEFISEGARVLDIGCGPGFPAWPLAVARPDLQVVAMDSSSKMLAFLAEHPLANLTVALQRAEEDIMPEEFDVVTGRAVAPFPLQAELSAGWLKVGGMFCPLRTPAEAEVISETNVGVLGLKLQSLEVRSIPGTETVRLLPVFEKVRPTPSVYPRTWARMKARPLGRS